MRKADEGNPPRMILVFGSLNVDLVARVPVIPGPGRTVLAPSYATHYGG
jgi:ribokinase